jgi:hypothetical protein
MDQSTIAEPGFDAGLIEQFIEPAAQAPALRVAVLTHSGRVPRFVLPLLDALARCTFVEMLRAEAPVPAHAPPGAPQDALLYRLYAAAVARGATDRGPYAYVDAEDRIGSWAVARVPAGYVPDVVLDVTPGPARAELGAAARYGLWRFEPGAADGGLLDAPHMVEFLDGEPASSMRLVQHGPGPGQRALLASADASMVAGATVTASRVVAAFNAAFLPLPVLRRLHAAGAMPVSAVSSAEPAGRRGRRSAGNMAVASWLARYGCRAIGNRLFRRDRVLHWRMALRASETPLYAGAGAGAVAAALREFRWIDSPRGHFWADPFLQVRGAQTWLFFEDFDYALGRAGLRATQIAADGSLGEAVPVLTRPYHLSYPHVFEADGETFMVPETSDAGVVELLRATDFPLRWERVSTLLRLRAVDSTVFRHADRWWMLTSPMSVSGHAPVTLLYSAAVLTGPWQLHPSSPISSDVRVARCAGAVIDCGGGRLLRPGQDCAGTYGRALVFNEIRRLDAAGYEETPVMRIGADAASGLSGVHTYNRAGRWEVIDGRFLQKRSQL